MTSLENPAVELLSTSELLSLPNPTWLLQGLIPESSMVGLYGLPSSGKSFIALDWAMCISEGMPWLGKYPTKQAPVVYIAAEGGSGIKKRVQAWMQHYGKTSLHAMYWITKPLYVREEGVVEAFLDSLTDEFGEPWYPGLVVIDTLSQSFGAGDENSSVDMGRFVQRVMALARGRMMSALIVHHKNATGNRERGHSSLRCNVDVMFDHKAEKNSDLRIVMVSIENDKQKDDAEAPKIYLAPLPVRNSLVFVEAPPPEAKKKKGDGPPRILDTVGMLTLLASHPEGLSYTRWKDLSHIPLSTFKRRIFKLTTANEIYKDGDLYFIYPATEDLVDEDDD